MSEGASGGCSGQPPEPLAGSGGLRAGVPPDVDDKSQRSQPHEPLGQRRDGRHLRLGDAAGQEQEQHDEEDQRPGLVHPEMRAGEGVASHLREDMVDETEKRHQHEAQQVDMGVQGCQRMVARRPHHHAHCDADQQVQPADHEECAGDVHASPLPFQVTRPVRRAGVT